MSQTTIQDIKQFGYDAGIAKPSVDITDPDIYSISGKGFEGLMVRVNTDTGEGFDQDDRDFLASLADPAGRCEREFQADYPNATAARDDLTAKGYVVDRTDANVNVFSLTGGDVALTGLGPDDLVTQNEALGKVKKAAKSAAKASS